MDDPGKTLSVPLYGQETNVWCWDASSLMVIKYFRPKSTLTQCEIASQATPGQICCLTPTPAPCVHTGWEMLSVNGFTFSTSTTALAYADLIAQIAKNKPVMYAIGWATGGGHMLVADGWFVLTDVKYVQVNDPWPPNVGTVEQQTYDYWVGGTGHDHVTWADFYDIVDTNAPVLKVKVPKLMKMRPWPPIPDPGPERLAVPVPEAIAAKANETLSEIREAPAEIVKRLGFVDAEEAGRAKLATPLCEYVVPADVLAAYTGKRAPTKLLTGGQTFFFPLAVGGKLRSSIRVAANGQNEAETIALGDYGTVQCLGRLEGLSAMLLKSSKKSIPVVRIPSLGLFFVVRWVKDSLQLASIYDVPNLKLKVGVFQNASQLFGQLAPHAKSLKGVM